MGVEYTVDAEFIQSVARVGDYVEVSLITGDRCQGVLAELTLSRLTLHGQDGRPVAVALPSIAMVRGLTPPEPAASPTAGQALPVSAPPPARPAPEATHATAETESPPATSVQAGPRPPAMAPPAGPAQHAFASVPAAQPSGADRGQHNGHEPSPAGQNALMLVASLKTVPVDTDVYVVPDERRQLEQIRDSYKYAEKINELEPRFGRIGTLIQRALYLWNADQKNAELTRLVGALSLQGGKVENAHARFAQAADLGDVPALRLLAVTAAKLDDPDTALYGLLQYFRSVAPDSDPDAWAALLAVLDSRGSRSQLGGLLDSESHDEVAREAVRHALGRAVPSPARMSRPPGAVPQPVSMPPLLTTTGLAMPSPRPLAKRAETQRSMAPLRPNVRGQNPYQVAKYLEHRTKDLKAAQNAYRQAIKKGIKRESAVKDLAWLTKRLEGSEAALKVIEDEFPGMIQPGNALDNILIDFLPGARRYDQALNLLQRQHDRPDITSSRRYHLAHQIAYVRLGLAWTRLPTGAGCWISRRITRRPSGASRWP